MERGVGAVIRISLPKTLPEGGGIKLMPKHYDGNHDIGNLATAPKVERKVKKVFAVTATSGFGDGVGGGFGTGAGGGTGGGVSFFGLQTVAEKVVFVVDLARP